MSTKAKLIKVLNQSLEIQRMAEDIGTEEAKAKADETWAMAMELIGDTAKTLEKSVKLLEQLKERYGVQS